MISDYIKCTKLQSECQQLSEPDVGLDHKVNTRYLRLYDFRHTFVCRPSINQGGMLTRWFHSLVVT